MHLLIYTSEYTGSQTNLESDVDRIVEKARRNNAAREITGVLFVGGRHFLQFLEGEHDTVERLFDRIVRDPRHDNVTLLWSTPIPSRGLSDWSMEQFALSGEGLNTLQLEWLRDRYQAMMTPSTEDIVTIYRDFLNASVSYS